MSLILSGSDGVSDIDGSASTPAIRGTDANTGIFFGTDVIGFSEGGVQSGEFNASGNLKLTGNLSVGGATPATSGSGITFPATASASSDANTLDDYEEGTWTPSIAGASSVTNTIGYYTKIGNRVFVQYYSGGFTASSVTPIVSGLPFTAKNATEGYGGVFTSNNTWTNGFFGYIGPNTSQFDSIVNGGGAYATVNTGSSKTIMIFGFYQTA